ncbi:hypothetical protein FRB99_003511 [Tulasnella sp. 403]|nr:hypothetical protein FRB99_003511 [Tulasnella sp. 403]
MSLIQTEAILDSETLANICSRDVGLHPTTSNLNDSRPHDFSTTPILLVSAFFPLPSSKHTDDEYAAWLRLYLSQVSTPMVVYTSRIFSPIIGRLRGRLPIMIDTSFNSPFDVPPMHGLEPIYSKQHDELDPEKSRHNPALYATWNAKAWLLQHAAERYGGNATKWFFWLDAGALRETHTFTHWPDLARVEEVFMEGSKVSHKPVEDLFFIPIWNPPDDSPFVHGWKQENGPMVQYKMSEGSMFGGQLPAVKWWAATFYALHDRYLSDNKFVGKDQNIFNTIMFLNPSRILTVWPRDPRHGIEADRSENLPEVDTRQCTWDPWYYFVFWLASEEERQTMREHMVSEYSQLSLPIQFLAWLGLPIGKAGRGECHLMKQWTFTDILREVIGRTDYS